MHLLLDVERRRLHDEIAPVLGVLATPDELRIQIAVPPLVRDLDRALLLFAQDGLVLGVRNVLPRGRAVLERLDLLPLGRALRRLRRGLLLRLRNLRHVYAPFAADAIVPSMSFATSDPSFASKSASISYTLVSSANAHRPCAASAFTPGTQ